MLKVTVHGEDELALRVIKPRGQCRGLAKVAAKLDHQYARVDSRNLFEKARCKR